jgi:hypothetical protein
MKSSFQITILCSLFFFSANMVQAQIDSRAYGYYEDALRFSQTTPYGSARFMALGGSGMALGGEIGAISANPAGLGVFNRSQFVFTPGIHFNQAAANYLGNTVDSEMTKFNVAGAGAIFNFKSENTATSKWRGGSLGITYNRTNDFNQNIQYSGYNDQNSIIDAMIEQSNGLATNQLSGISLAGYDHYLVNPLPDSDNVYDSFVLGFPDQREIIERRGGINQINISFGGNYNDHVYFGAGVGILSANYSQSRVFTENFVDEPLEQFTMDEWLKVKGTGVNVSLGLIFRPVSFLRFGASYTSPTWYKFTEESDIYYQSNYDNYDVANWVDGDGNRLIQEDTVLNILNSNTDLFVSEYNLRTPAKLNIGASLVLGKLAFFSADVELVDHGNAHVSSSDFISEGDNNTIKDLYKPVMNIKVGGELRISALRLRAGLALYGDPYNFTDEIDRSKLIASAGIGVNFGKVFFDVGLSRTVYNENILVYALGNSSPVASVENTINNAQFSLGFNF